MKYEIDVYFKSGRKVELLVEWDEKEDGAYFIRDVYGQKGWRKIFGVRTPRGNGVFSYNSKEVAYILTCALDDD